MRFRIQSQGNFTLTYEIITPPNGLIRRSLYQENLTWAFAYKACDAVGKTLCHASDICEYTDGRPFYGVEEVDQWTPVLDEYNDWLQVSLNIIIINV